MLRNVPSDDYLKRPWAATIAAEFGRLAMRHGVIVVNDPERVGQGVDQDVLPAVSRGSPAADADHARSRRDQGVRQLVGDASCSSRCRARAEPACFWCRQSDMPNLNQMIDAVSRDGFVIAQEYLPAAEEGDMRLFVMNGRPLQVKGKYAAFRRVRSGDDMRSNIHAGGKLAPAEVDDTALRIAEIVRPKLVQDGMFLVGLDIVGDQVDGDQRLQSRRLGECTEIHEDQFQQVRHRSPGTKSQLHALLRPQL